MPLFIVRKDINELKVDAVVGYRKSERNERGDEELLRKRYRNALLGVSAGGYASVAVPLILNGYTKDNGLKVAVSEISSYLDTLKPEEEITAYIVVSDRDSFDTDEETYSELDAFINANITERPVPTFAAAGSAPAPAKPGFFAVKKRSGKANSPKSVKVCEECLAYDEAGLPGGLSHAVDTIDESFQEMLLRKIDEKGMRDSECYKKANIDRKHFSKIRKDKFYKPSKPTVIAFAVALELSLDETREMLMKAGFALSRSQKFDIIVEYFISRKVYNVNEINEALFAYDQVLLGA